MFILDAEPTFTHEITARVPVDGGFDDQKFKVTYRVLPDATIAEFKMTEDGSAMSFLKAAVVKFDDVADKNDQPIPYSDRARDQLIGLPFVRNPMIAGYFAAVYPARLGN